MKKYSPIDMTAVKTYSIKTRNNKVNVDQHFGKPIKAGMLSSALLDAMPKLRRRGVNIDCVYLDSGHYYEETKTEIKSIKKYFPNAFLCGDDYSRDDCRQGLNEISEELGLTLIVIDNAWILLDDIYKGNFEPYTNYLQSV